MTQVIRLAPEISTFHPMAFCKMPQWVG